jgi:DnaJ family protein C protein 13
LSNDCKTRLMKSLIEQNVSERGEGPKFSPRFPLKSIPVFQGAGLLMKAIIEEGSEATGQKMQMLALAEGAVPIHLVKALFIKSEDNRLLMQRQLSRHLISLWTAGNDAATELLQRILVS